VALALVDRPVLREARTYLVETLARFEVNRGVVRRLISSHDDDRPWVHRRASLPAATCENSSA
jgi:hypothetical protein